MERILQQSRVEFSVLKRLCGTSHCYEQSFNQYVCRDGRPGCEQGVSTLGLAVILVYMQYFHVS